MATGGHRRYGQMGPRGGLCGARLSRSDQYFRHGGGLCHRGGRSQRVRSAPGAHLGDLTCRRPEVTFWVIGRGDNPKAGKMGLQRVANMRRDGPVPAQERSCAAGDVQGLPSRKVRLVQLRLGERPSRLSRIEATYRKTSKPDRRNRGLLAGAE